MLLSRTIAGRKLRLGLREVARGKKGRRRSPPPTRDIGLGDRDPLLLSFPLKRHRGIPVPQKGELALRCGRVRCGERCHEWVGLSHEAQGNGRAGFGDGYREMG
jgi:hypothetical protein